MMAIYCFDYVMSTSLNSVTSYLVPNHNSGHKRSSFHTSCVPYSKKSSTLSRIFLLFVIFFCPQIVLSQDIVYIDYVEAFNDEDSVGISLPMKNKTERSKSSSAISFSIEHEENVADSIVKCLEVVTDIWKSCLNINTNYKIRLELTWEDLPNDEDIRTKVTYVSDSLH